MVYAYSFQKCYRNCIGIQAGATEMIPDEITLSKVSQPQVDNTVWLHLYLGKPKNSQIHKNKYRRVGQ